MNANTVTNSFETVIVTGSAVGSQLNLSPHAVMNLPTALEQFVAGWHGVKSSGTALQLFPIFNTVLLISGSLLISYAVLIFIQELLKTIELAQQDELDLIFITINKEDNQALFWLLIGLRLLFINLTVPAFILLIGLSVLQSAGVAGLAAFATSAILVTLVHIAPIILLLYFVWRLVNIWNDEKLLLDTKIFQTAIALLIIMTLISSVIATSAFTVSVISVFLAILLFTVYLAYQGYQIPQKLSHQYGTDTSMAKNYADIETYYWCIGSSVFIFAVTMITLAALYFFAPGLLTLGLLISLMLLTVVVILFCRSQVVLNGIIFDDLGGSDPIMHKLQFSTAHIGFCILLAVGFLASVITLSLSVSFAPAITIVFIMMLTGVIIGWVSKQVFVDQPQNADDQSSIATDVKNNTDLVFVDQPQNADDQSSIATDESSIATDVKNNTDFITAIMVALIASGVIGFLLFTLLPQLFIPAIIGLSLGIIAIEI